MSQRRVTATGPLAANPGLPAATAVDFLRVRAARNYRLRQHGTIYQHVTRLLRKLLLARCLGSAFGFVTTAHFSALAKDCDVRFWEGWWTCCLADKWAALFKKQHGKKALVELKR